MTDGLALYLAAWLLTYLIHSTLLLGGVFIVLRIGGRRLETWAELAWRVAMFGAVVTSVVQMALPTFIVTEPAGSITRVTLGVVPLIIGFWLVIASLRVTALVLSLWTVRRRLAGRAYDLHIGARANEMAGGATIRLSLSSEIATPMVLGTRELCLPTRTLHELSTDEVDAVLAHEVAHVLRRDPFWLTLAAVVQRALFMQPLNALASTRMRALAECSCDDWALARTGNPLALASALARVTEWIVRTPAHAVVIAMASRESLALARVRRILDGRTHTNSLAPKRARTSALLLLVATVLLVPGISAKGGFPYPYTISAFDAAGPFTVTVEQGKVIGVSVDGVRLPFDHVQQTGGRVHVRDPRGAALELKLNTSGGMSWQSRPAR